MPDTANLDSNREMGTGPSDRVAVFIDYQNAYGFARSLFGGRLRLPPSQPPPPSFGHVDPRRLGEILAATAPPGRRAERRLSSVHVFRGLPDPARSPVLWQHCTAAVERWRADGVFVTTPPVRWVRGLAREKGVDVALACDVLDRALQGQFEVAILFTADQDLLPLVALLRSGRVPLMNVELAGWDGRDGAVPSVLRAPGAWAHRLGWEQFYAARERGAGLTVK